MLIMKENRDEHAYQSSCTCARTSHFDVKVRTHWPFAYTYTLWAYDVYITSMLQCSVSVCLLIRTARSSFCFISDFFSLFHLVSVSRGFLNVFFIFSFQKIFSFIFQSCFFLFFLVSNFSYPFKFECLSKSCILVASPTMYKLPQNSSHCTHKLP